VVAYWLGIFLPRIDLVVALLMLFTIASLIWWSFGWAHYRYARVERPPWIVHPATRAILAALFFTFVAAWPFGSSSNALVTFAGIALAPAIGSVLGAAWFLVFGLRQLQSKDGLLRPAATRATPKISVLGLHDPRVQEAMGTAPAPSTRPPVP